MTTDHNAIEFSFYAVETGNRYEAIEDESVGVHQGDKGGAGRKSGDKGWQRYPAPGRGRRKPRPPKQPQQAPDWSEEEVDAINGHSDRIDCECDQCVPGGTAVRQPIDHMVYSYERGWQQEMAAMASPTLPVRLSVCQQAYVDLQRQPPKSAAPGRALRSVVKRLVSDTGAQMNVLDGGTAKELGIDLTSIIPTMVKMNGAARGSSLKVIGVVFLDVAVPGWKGQKESLPQQFYVIENVRTSYLSRRCLIDLGVIGSDFPKAGVVWSPWSLQEVAAVGEGEQ